MEDPPAAHRPRHRLPAGTGLARQRRRHPGHGGLGRHRPVHHQGVGHRHRSPGRRLDSASRWPPSSWARTATTTSPSPAAATRRARWGPTRRTRCRKTSAPRPAWDAARDGRLFQNFTNGVSLANPTPSSVTVAFDAPVRNLKGETSTSVTLPPTAPSPRRHRPGHHRRGPGHRQAGPELQPGGHRHHRCHAQRHRDRRPRGLRRVGGDPRHRHAAVAADRRHLGRLPGAPGRRDRRRHAEGDVEPALRPEARQVRRRARRHRRGGEPERHQAVAGLHRQGRLGRPRPDRTFSTVAASGTGST